MMPERQLQLGVGVEGEGAESQGTTNRHCAAKTKCLSTKNTTRVNRLKRMGLGYPESLHQKESQAESQLPWRLKSLKDFLALINAEYDLAYATQNNLYLVQAEINTPALIKEYLIKSASS